MARPKSTTLTDTEQKIMEILWRDGPSSVRHIADELSKEKPTAYTSAQTMCKILAEKGHSTYTKEGRAFIYEAQTSQTDAKQSALTSLLDRFFGGSSSSLTQYLMKETDIDEDTLDELQKTIDQKSKK